MSALILGNEQLALLDDLAVRAAANPFPLAMMQALARREIAPPGNFHQYGLRLPINYRLVFTIEEHPLKAGGTVWCRHLSVSLSGVRKGRVPRREAVQFLATRLGFPAIEECTVWTEDAGERIAVNILSLYE